MKISLTKEQQDIYASNFKLLCDQAKMRVAKTPNSLCYYCNRITGCNWLDNTNPVKGWQAIRNDMTFKQSNDTVVTCKSYFVYGCPNFVQAKEREGIHYAGE